jgi:hypothetical protein
VPGGEVGVVSSELVEVLVDPSGAVVFEQEGPWGPTVGAFDLKYGVGEDWPGGWILESGGGPFLGLRELGLAVFEWGVDRRFAVPFHEAFVEQLAVGEDPGVELKVVDDVAVVD